MKEFANNNLVEITAADYSSNGGFDGSPFSHIPNWLCDAIINGVIKGVNPNTTDYLEWAVMTHNGNIVNAGHGDQIAKDENGNFSVIKWKNENYDRDISTGCYIN